MSFYRVTWTLDIDGCETPEEAAIQALKIQRDPNTIATCFNVFDHITGEAKNVDLQDIDDFSEWTEDEHWED